MTIRLRPVAEALPCTFRGGMGARIFRWAAGGVFACAAAASGGDLGRIEGRIDGREAGWNTLTIERNSGTQASATARFGQRLAEIQLQGYPELTFTSRDVFSIEVRYAAPFDPEAMPMSVDFLFTPNGLRGPFWSSRGAPVAPVFQVLRLDAWGAVGELDALFAGQICRRERISASTDIGACQEVSGRVQTELFVTYGSVRSGGGRGRVDRPDRDGSGAE